MQTTVRHRRTLRTGVVVAVVSVVTVLAAGELGVRATKRYLPEPARQANPWADSKVARMKRLAISARPPKVVVAGTSMAMCAVAPEALGAALGRRVYNTALPGASPVVTEPWLLQQVVPRLHPDTVVYGLSSVDLNSDAARAKRFAATVTPRGLVARMDQAVSSRSALFRYRSVLRRPGQLVQSLRRTRTAARSVTDPRAGTTDTGQGFIGHGGLLPVIHAENWLRNFRTAGPDQLALARILDELTHRRIRVVVVLMPVPERYIAAHPHGAADYQDAIALIRRLAGSRHLPVVDRTSEFTAQALFADSTHMLPAGAQAFTTAIGPDIAAALRR